MSPAKATLRPAMRKVLEKHRAAVAELQRVAKARPLDPEALNEAARRAHSAASELLAQTIPAMWNAQAKKAQEFDEAFDHVSACLKGCLMVGGKALDRGNKKTAAEYVIGAIEDLAPELGVIRRALPRGTTVPTS